jgi:hypothetical protein
MSQTWDSAVGSDQVVNAVKVKHEAKLESLRTLFSGATEPASKVAYMLWADTALGLLKQRNAANSAWVVLGPLLADWTEHVCLVGELSSLSASRSLYLPPQRVASVVRRIIIVSATASSSSSGNEWQFELEDMTSPGDLFSAAVGTFTALSGVGGGAEFAANGVFALTPDQNQALDPDHVVELRFVKVGTVTTLSRISVFAEMSRAG